VFGIDEKLRMFVKDSGERRGLHGEQFERIDLGVSGSDHDFVAR